MKSILITILFVTSLFSSIYTQEKEKHPFVAVAETLSENETKPEKTTKSDTVNPTLEASPKQSNGYVRPNAKKRFKRYVNNIVGLNAFARAGASAGFSTITNNHEEWERNGEGFARRFASNLGSNAIKQTVIYSLDEALEVDSKYYKSKKKDFGSRVKNAVLSTVTARNKKGKRVVGMPRIAGTYSSAIISRETWFPKRFDYKDGLRSGTISLGISAGFNLIKEYF